MNNIKTIERLPSEASLNEILEKNKALALAIQEQTLILKENLEAKNVFSNSTKLSELVANVNDIQNGVEMDVEMLEHSYGDPAFISVPSPVLNLNLEENATDLTELNFSNPKYNAKVLGDGEALIEDGVFKTDGTKWIDIDYPIGKEGGILINFTAERENVSNVYGRVFRGNSDGISIFYKRDTNVYEIKAYHGGYLQNINPEDIEGKRALITWSNKKGQIDLYVDGELLSGSKINPKKMLSNHSFYISDNQQKVEGRIPFYMPLEISEFKLFDCYIDANIAKEV